LLRITSNSNCPTAPEKFLGFPLSGNFITVIILLPVVIILEAWSYIILPKKSL